MISSNDLQQIDIMIFNIKILQSYELSAVYIHSQVYCKISVSGKWKKPNFWSRKIKKRKKKKQSRKVICLDLCKNNQASNSFM